MFSMASAWAGTAAVAAVYVLPLWLWNGLPRDHPHTIKGRAMCTLMACSVAWLPLCMHLTQALGQAPSTDLVLKLLCIRVPGLATALRLPLALTAVLFLGPMLLELLQPAPPMPAPCPGSRPLVLLRAFVVAPLTEEFAFRSCIAPLWLLQGASVGRVIATVPLVFAAAHLHHVFELVRYQRWPLRQALLTVLMQSCYTYLFGCYATWLLLRTGHIWAAVLPHAFCNYMGFPRFGLMAGRPLLMAALAAGIALFCMHLGRWTDPQLYGNACYPFWGSPAALHCHLGKEV